MADLEYSDYYSAATNAGAYYQPRVGADLINFNRYYVSGLSAELRRHAGIHETGNALGLGDRESSQYSRIVML